MELITPVLLAIATGAASTVGACLVDRVKKAIHDWSRDKRDDQILAALKAIGNLSDADVKARVEEIARDKKIPADQCQELTNLIKNLAHGTRFHTTNGTLRSSVVRCSELIDRLLHNLQPERKAGQPVSTGVADWVLTRFLGMGTFGEVWQAENRGYPETRAFKFFTSADGVRWLAAEQRTLFHVKTELGDHPNIVKFLDVAIRGAPHPYLALEYVAGGSLEDWILSHSDDRRKLDKQEIVAGLVRGLSQAHGKNIAHRDLKPANLLLTNDPTDVQVKIADFGLGRVAPTQANVSAAVSQAGVVVGTGMYLPPEAMQPFQARNPEQDDVFAVGVIWYQLEVEKLERPPYDFADQLRHRAVGSQTIRLIERCLAQPSGRYKDACELEQALDECELPPIREVPPGCFDVQYLAREYLASKMPK